MSDYFPNGLPRLVTWYTEIDGIKYVIGQGGEKMPVLDDNWIMLDTKKGMHIVNSYYPVHEVPYDETSPIKIELATSYEKDDDEALKLARYLQADLEKGGHYVPIYHRD